MHWIPQAKKLVSVLAISTLVTGTKKAPKIRVLDWVSYIHYPMQFRKDRGKDVLTLLNSESKVNAMTPALELN